jgi:hypothetical protein
VATLYLGHLALLTGDVNGAEAAYARVLAADPGNVRSTFGTAEVAFQRARATACVSSPGAVAPTDALVAVRARFEAALAAYRTGVADGEPALPFLESQAHLQLGRVQLCLLPSDPAAGVAARTELDQVVAAHAAADGPARARLVDAAAEAYAGLGYLALTEPAPAYADALRDLDQAVELGVGARKDLFTTLRSFVKSRLGDTAAAAADCRGVSLKPCPLPVADRFLRGFTEPIPLPATGSPGTAATSLLALALVVVGAVLVRCGRRRAAPGRPT